MPLQIRRGTEAERQAMTVPLAEGELLYVTDDQRLFIGGKAADGTPIANGVLVTGYNDIDAKAAAASLFAAGTHSNITFVYDDGTGSISATVDLSNYQDVITANGIKAPILGANDFELFNSATNDLQLNGVISSDVTPKETGIFDLGSPSLTFNNLYLNNALWIGTAEITSDGSAINLPIGSTVNGVLIGADGDTGIVEGSNYRINIIGEDSSLLVDSANGTFFGNLTGSLLSNDGSTLLVNSDNNSINAPGGISGDVTGNVTGSVISNDGSTFIVNLFDNSINASGGISGNLSGDVTGNVTGNLSGNVIDSDGLTIVDSLTGTVFGNFIGSVNGDVTGNVISTNGTTIVNSTTNTFTGNFVGSFFGDGSGLTNLPSSIFDLNDVFSFSPPDFGDMLIFDGSNFVPQKVTRIEGSDSTIILDTTTNTFTGNFIGDFTGNFVGNDIRSTDGLYIFSDVPIVTRVAGLSDGSSLPTLQIHGFNGSIENPTLVSANQFVSSLEFTVQNVIGQPREEGKSIAAFTAQTDSSANMSHSAPAGNLFLTVGAGDGQGDDFTGNYRIFAWQQDGSFSSNIITHRAQSSAQVAAITPIAGMVVFDSTTQKFRGYVDDTGLASGGAPNSTPGWIDLH